jgi:hypothetical protein
MCKAIRQVYHSFELAVSKKLKIFILLPNTEISASANFTVYKSEWCQPFRCLNISESQVAQKQKGGLPDEPREPRIRFSAYLIAGSVFAAVPS